MRNEDALTLRSESILQFSYEAVNPFAFAEPIAPHIAASNINSHLSVANVLTACRDILDCSADYLIIERAGGWKVPLNDQETMADLAKAFGFPIIVVVGIRLGCINHALLTQESLSSANISVAGWVANVLDKDVLYPTENIESIQKRIPFPLLGIVPYQPSINAFQASTFLDFDHLVGERSPCIFERRKQ